MQIDKRTNSWLVECGWKLSAFGNQKSNSSSIVMDGHNVIQRTLSGYWPFITPTHWWVTLRLSGAVSLPNDFSKAWSTNRYSGLINQHENIWRMYVAIYAWDAKIRAGHLLQMTVFVNQSLTFEKGRNPAGAKQYTATQICSPSHAPRNLRMKKFDSHGLDSRNR